MIELLFSNIETFLAAYGTPALFLMGFLEEVIFFIPSSFVFLGAGFLGIPSNLTFWQALLTSFLQMGVVATAGVTLGSFVIYGLVYWGGHKFIDAYGGYFGVSWNDINKFRQRFTKGYTDEVTLFVCRAVPFFPFTIISAFSGLIRIHWKEFFWITVLGTSIRVTFLGLIGWWAGKEYRYYALQIAETEKYFLIIIALLVIGGLFFYYGKRKS